MNIHKNARLTLVRRLEMVQDVIEQKLALTAVADCHGVSVPTVRKWVGRYLAQGESGLADASSRSRVSPRAISAQTALAIVELRRRWLTQACIAKSLGLSNSTVSRVLARAGLSRWADLEPTEATVRYEHAHPGDLLHIDTKKLGRIERRGHRVTGARRHDTVGAGYEFLFVAVDDHARLGFTQLKPDERCGRAVSFLRAAIKYFAQLGVTVRRVLTDNGNAFRSKQFARACQLAGSSIPSLDPIDRKRMARPNVSSNRPCANGRMAFHITIPRSEPTCSIAGFITTTGIARTAA